MKWQNLKTEDKEEIKRQFHNWPVEKLKTGNWSKNTIKLIGKSVERWAVDFGTSLNVATK